MRKKLFCVVSFVLMLILTGCWDRYEIEERANILGLAIDVVDQEEGESELEIAHPKGEFPIEDQKYLKVTAQIALPGKIKLGPEGSSGEGSEKNAWVIETVGHTIRDAMANLQQQLAEKLYLGHLQIVIISENIAKNGISDINEFLRRNYEVRRTAWMVVNDDDAAKVLQAAPPVETVPSLYLSETLDNAVRFGKLPRDYLGRFWIDLADDGTEAILPAVKVIDENRILIDGMAYFKENKMAGRTTPIEIGAYMIMKEKNPGGYSLFVNPEDVKGAFLLKAQESQSKIKVYVENGQPSATIEVNIDAEIEEDIKSNSLGEETIEKIENAANLNMEEICKGLLNKLKENGSDVLGIGSRVRSKYRSYWNTTVKTDEEWEELFKEIDIKVKVNYSIRRTGMEWK